MKSKIKISAFSIVEMLVSLVVLAFGIFSAADLLINAQKSAHLNERRMHGNSLAQLKLEELRCAALDPINQGTVEYEKSGTFEQNPIYAWRATIRVAEPPAALGQINIVITNAASGEHVSKLSGLIAPVKPAPGERAEKS